MTTSSASPTRTRATRALAVLGGFALVALASAIQVHLLAQVEGRESGLGRALLTAAPPWIYWAMVTPLVAWWTRKLRDSGRGWWAIGTGHLVAALVAGAGQALVLGGSLHLFGFTAQMTETVGEFFRLIFVSRLYLTVLVYGVIVGAVTAVDYRAQVRERDLRAARLETQLTRARLDVLRMQLNPHFLFNTLNAVSAQVRAGRGEAAVSMLGGLGDLLRYALDAGDEPVVPLWRERAFLERYAEIERVRFSDRLELSIDLPDDLAEVRVPPLLLQPLVENAVRHGIAPRDAPGRVEVEARCEGSRLVLVVRDDGLGLSGQQEAGIGLGTTRARLEELYPGDHRFTVQERSTGGVEVRVEIPLQEPGGTR